MQRRKLSAQVPIGCGRRPSSGMASKRPYIIFFGVHRGNADASDIHMWLDCERKIED